MGSAAKMILEEMDTILGESFFKEMDIIPVDRELLRRKDLSLLAKLVWEVCGMLSEDFTLLEIAEELGVSEDECFHAWKELLSDHEKNTEWWKRLSLKPDAKEQ